MMMGSKKKNGKDVTKVSGFCLIKEKGMDLLSALEEAFEMIECGDGDELNYVRDIYTTSGIYDGIGNHSDSRKKNKKSKKKKMFWGARVRKLDYMNKDKEHVILVRNDGFVVRVDFK
jgi:hypothetical protein